MTASASSVRGETAGLAATSGSLLPTTGAALELHGVTKAYGAAIAVDDLTLAVAPGQFLTLLGPSGAGKSTALHLIAGLTEPTSGRVVIDGREAQDVPPEKRNVGIVFQNYALFPHLTVARNLAFPLEMRGVGRDEIKRRVAETLALVGLEGLDGRRPHELSGGQQQRVALARVLIYRPRIVLMDEPLGALDRNLRQQMQLEIHRLHRELGLTVVYVTHDQSEALSMSDQIAVMERGRIVQVGRPQELYERPHNTFVATFLGEANLLPGTVTELDRAAGRAVATADGINVRGPANGLAVGQPVTLVVRPEVVRVRKLNGDQRGIAATVESVSYVGEAFRVQLTDEHGRSMLAKLPAGVGSAPDVGDRVLIDWPEDRATFVIDERAGGGNGSVAH